MHGSIKLNKKEIFIVALKDRDIEIERQPMYGSIK
jgi:hypothetical protein